MAGLPAMNRSRIFNWPVRRVIHRYWKLAYEESLDQKSFIELLQLPNCFATSLLGAWGMEHGPTWSPNPVEMQLNRFSNGPKRSSVLRPHVAGEFEWQGHD